VHPESEGKILEIASQLGKKTGVLGFILSHSTCLMWLISKKILNKSKTVCMKNCLDIISEFFIVGLAFVDCTASSDTIVVLKQVVDLGCCVVMANKKPLTSTMVRSLQVFHINC